MSNGTLDELDDEEVDVEPARESRSPQDHLSQEASEEESDDAEDFIRQALLER